MFHLCALFYGDHPDLACRLLDSWFKCGVYWPDVADVRLGLNAVSNASLDAILTLARRVPAPVYLYQPHAGQNVYKYPLMRRMFQGATAPLIQWFDDDSYLRGIGAWSEIVALSLKHLVHDETPGLLGSVYLPGYHWTAAEQEKIKAQPWYTGKPLQTKPQFCTGGWWVAQRLFLRQWDYPFRDLRHNGGDVLLGELLRQQGGRLIGKDLAVRRRISSLVAINADAAGKESASARRGETTLRPWEVGALPGDHSFALKIEKVIP